MLALGLLGLVAFALLYWRKRKLQDSVEAQFRSFRERAVALMDQLDGLRQRHKTLPATDPDFKVPMTGATLALYNQISRELNDLWERWLKLMEIWDQTQKHIRAGTGLATKPTEEARRLLAGGEVDELVRQSTACKEQLDHLNQGHENARANLAAARAELAAAQSVVSKGTGVLIPSDAHHSEMSEAERKLSEADSMIASDPIGALEQIAEVRRALAASLQERPDGRPTWHRHPTEFPPIFSELLAAAERLRAAVARLRLTDLLGLFIKAWVTVWILGLLFGTLFPMVLPIAIFVVGWLIILGGGLTVVRAMMSWFHFAFGRPPGPMDYGVGPPRHRFNRPAASGPQDRLFP
ncbi:MAG: hypothetical protein JO161_08525 [Planctomycetaceae bacterium]|nr:hypothetical protein [Planctomycetaceae bacterium]